MKKFIYVTFAIVALVFTSCEENIETSELNFINFAEEIYKTGVDVASTTKVEVVVYTTNSTDSERSFDVDVDGSAAGSGSYTIPSTVTVPAGSNKGILEVTLTDSNLGIGTNTVAISLVAKEGLIIGGNTAIQYIQNCNEVTATLNIEFDGYGSESSWEILDSLGAVVASQAQGIYSDGQASASETITLCSGRDFTFKFYDSYGDGLSYPNNGTITLTIGGVVKAKVSGDFGSEYSTSFDTK